MMNRGRNSHDYEASSEESSEFDLRRGPWTLEEDNLLIHYITCHGEGRWNTLAKCAGFFFFFQTSTPFFSPFSHQESTHIYIYIYYNILFLITLFQKEQILMICRS